MAFVADALAYRLAELGHGTLTIDLFSDRAPETPDTVTALLENPGPPTYAFGPRPDVGQHAVQLLVRGEPDDYEQARTRAHVAHQALWGVTGLTVDVDGLDVVLLAVVARETNPTLMDRDDRDRFVWSSNFDVTARTVVVEV